MKKILLSILFICISRFAFGLQSGGSDELTEDSVGNYHLQDSTVQVSDIDLSSVTLSHFENDSYYATTTEVSDATSAAVSSYLDISSATATYYDKTELDANFLSINNSTGELSAFDTVVNASTQTLLVDKGTWTFVVFPDAQEEVKRSTYSFEQQCQWTADNKEAYNIKFVMIVGDLVTTWNDTTEWSRIMVGLNILEAANIPIIVGFGNHEVGVSKSTTFNSYIDYDTFYGDNDWFDGDTFTSDSSTGTECIYTKMTIEGDNFILMTIPYDPSELQKEWAADIANTYPDYKVILCFHSYLGTGTNLTPNQRNTDGDEIWDDFIDDSPNTVLVFCGHYQSYGRHIDFCKNGNAVIAMKYDRSDGWNTGYVRINQMYPNQQDIHSMGYGTINGTWEPQAEVFTHYGYKKRDLEYDRFIDTAEDGSLNEALNLGGYRMSSSSDAIMTGYSIDESRIDVTVMDSTGIINAITALGGEGKLRLLKGSYIITEQICVPAGVDIEGCGWSTILDASSLVAPANGVISLDGNNIRLVNFKMLGNSGGGGTSLIKDSVGVTDCTFDTLWLVNSDDIGIHLSNGASHDNNIINCTIESCEGVGISFGGEYNYAFGNTIKSCNWGMAVGGYENRVMGNDFETNSNGAVCISGQWNVILSNHSKSNKFYITGEYNLISNNEIYQPNDHIINLTGSDGNIISDNYCNSAANGKANIYLNGSDNNDIDNNKSIGGTNRADWGIYLTNSFGNRITNNTLDDHDNIGIFEDSNCNNNDYSGNKFYDNTQNYDLRGSSITIIYGDQGTVVIGTHTVSNYENVLEIAGNVSMCGDFSIGSTNTNQACLNVQSCNGQDYIMQLSTNTHSRFRIGTDGKLMHSPIGTGTEISWAQGTLTNNVGNYKLAINAASGSDAQINLCESGSNRWQVFNDGTDDSLNINGASPGNVLKFDDVGNADFSDNITAGAHNVYEVRIATSLADTEDFEVTDMDGKAGWGIVNAGGHASGGQFSFAADGVVTLSDHTNLNTTVDNDTTLNVSDSGTTITLSNELGGRYVIFATIYYID